jgi:4-hydroxy-tetrahydrodipicolinate reductase
MKIGLIGYGKMGKTIEQIAIKRGHAIVARIDSKSTESDWDELTSADVCIEFSRPEVALMNFKKCFERKIKVVTGTTGWYNSLEQIEQDCNQATGSFFWASNFSIGVHLFWKVNETLAKLMNAHPEYKASIEEIHHTEKLDAPSGTAITTANQIIAHHEGYSTWQLHGDASSDDELEITAKREHDVKGTHIVSYESPIDRIQIVHEAKTREGFALGAVLAAEFLQDKVGVYTMSDLLKEH